MSAPTAARRRVATGVQLALTPEPLALKGDLRALAEEQPARAATQLIDPNGVAAYLWHRWGAPLERAGIREDAYLDVLAGYQRELWYWLWGNRTWAQCTQGLAGRLIRRAERRTATRPRPNGLGARGP
jgi:hypothetical protein